MGPIFGAVLFFWATAAEHPRDFYRELVQIYAPVIAQRTGHNPMADALTRVDFDGDFVSNNNWDNLEKYPTEAYVYYEVIESKTHYFITYAFFHPRDYSRLCIYLFCHENDLEGAILTVEKTEDSQWGRLFQVETLAHDRMHMTRLPHLVDSSTLEHSAQGQVVLDIEAGGHGVYPWEGLWPKSVLLYSFQNRPDDPKGAKAGHYSYQLLPLAQLMALKDSLGRGQLFNRNYKHVGIRFSAGDLPSAFAGEKWSDGLARPPWAWFDRKDYRMKRGDWFLDPAKTAFRHDGLAPAAQPTEPKDIYVYNPYLGVTGDPGRD